MKKVIFGLGLAGIVSGCLVGICLLNQPKEVYSTVEDGMQIRRTYEAVGVDFLQEGKINFDVEKQTFQYFPSIVSSVVLTGMYEISEKQITLKPEGNGEILVFQAEGDTLKFDRTASTMDTKLENGTIFQERISE